MKGFDFTDYQVFGEVHYSVKSNEFDNLICYYCASDPDDPLFEFLLESWMPDSDYVSFFDWFNKSLSLHGRRSLLQEFISIDLSLSDSLRKFINQCLFYYRTLNGFDISIS